MCIPRRRAIDHGALGAMRRRIPEVPPQGHDPRRAPRLLLVRRAVQNACTRSSRVPGAEAAQVRSCHPALTTCISYAALGETIFRADRDCPVASEGLCSARGPPCYLFHEASTRAWGWLAHRRRAGFFIENDVDACSLAQLCRQPRLISAKSHTLAPAAAGRGLLTRPTAHSERPTWVCSRGLPATFSGDEFV